MYVHIWQVRTARSPPPPTLQVSTYMHTYIYQYVYIPAIYTIQHMHMYIWKLYTCTYVYLYNAVRWGIAWVRGGGYLWLMPVHPGGPDPTAIHCWRHKHNHGGKNTPVLQGGRWGCQEAPATPVLLPTLGSADQAYIWGPHWGPPPFNIDTRDTTTLPTYSLRWCLEFTCCQFTVLGAYPKPSVSGCYGRFV
jgi:hypothetical protein